MGMIQAVRNLFASPYDPAIMDRSAYGAIDLRMAAGQLVVPPSQLNRPQWTTGTPQRYVTEGWGKAPVVFACVMAIADQISTARIAVVEDQGNGQLEPAEDTDLQALLNRPNPQMDQAEFFQIVSVIAELSGICVVEKERNNFGEVIGLWPLRTDWLKPIPRTESAPAWEYRIPGYRDPEILEPEDVWVYTAAPDPNLGYLGTSPLAVAFRELGIENMMTDFLKAFFDRGALPVYGIVPKMPIKTQQEADSFRERMMGKYGGATKSAEPLLLTGVEDVKRLGFDFDELAYPELRALSETQICTAFRVPPILIGVQAGLDAATYSNYGQARRNFVEDVIRSKWTRLDGALSRGLVPEFDDTGRLSVEFDTSDVPALQDDTNDTWRRATAGLQAGGITVNDFRREVGLPPLTTGGDVLYVPFSATPTPVAIEGQRSRELLPGVRIIEDPAIPEGTIRALGSPYELRDGRTYLRFDALPDHERTRHTRAAQHNRDMIGKLTAMLEPRMATFFAEQGERVGMALFGGTERHRVAMDGTDLKRALEDWQWNDELAQLRTLIEQWFGEAGAAMFTELSKQLNSDIAWSTGNQYISELYEQLGTRIVGIHETTRKTVEEIIVNGLTEGKSIPQMADDLQQVFDGFGKTRALTISRTESQFAANTSAAAAYDASGITRAVIYDNPAHTTDPGADGLTCSERNGLVVPVRQTARHAGGTHPNCTMAVGPIVEGA